jgi:hypothetical protein
MVESASSALDAAGLEHWFFGGWAVDLWVGRLTRPHDDIDVLVWRHDQASVHEALVGAGWMHTPTPEDLVGTNYARSGYEIQATFVVPGAEGGVIVPVPEQPIVLSSGPLAFARRKLNGLSVRVLTLEMMLALKGTSRPDEVGGAKDRADLKALRSVAKAPSKPSDYPGHLNRTLAKGRSGVNGTSSRCPALADADLTKNTGGCVT